MRSFESLERFMLKWIVNSTLCTNGSGTVNKPRGNSKNQLTVLQPTNGPLFDSKSQWASLALNCGSLNLLKNNKVFSLFEYLIPGDHTATTWCAKSIYGVQRMFSKTFYVMLALTISHRWIPYWVRLYWRKKTESFGCFQIQRPRSSYRWVLQS